MSGSGPVSQEPWYHDTCQECGIPWCQASPECPRVIWDRHPRKPVTAHPHVKGARKVSGLTVYDEDASIMIATFVLDTAQSCTVDINTLCGADATQWVLVRQDTGIEVRGRCDKHPAQDSLKLLHRCAPELKAIGVITKPDDFASTIE